MNRSAYEEAMDILRGHIAGSLGGELIADVPCNDCSMVHHLDLVSGAVSVEVRAGDLLLLDQHSDPITSVSVVTGDKPDRRVGRGSVGPDVRVVEFHLAAKRRGRGNMQRRASLDSGLAVTTRLAELCAGHLYVDRHNLPCPRAECIKCREPLPLRMISVLEIDCWRCSFLSRIALGTMDTKILYPDDFTGDEREFAKARGVKLSVQSSSAFGDLYLATVCSECGSVQGDWTLDVDIHHRTLSSTSHRRAEFGPCAKCAERSCDRHGRYHDYDDDECPACRYEDLAMTAKRVR